VGPAGSLNLETEVVLFDQSETGAISQRFYIPDAASQRGSNAPLTSRINVQSNLGAADQERFEHTTMMADVSDNPLGLTCADVSSLTRYPTSRQQIEHNSVLVASSNEHFSVMAQLPKLALSLQCAACHEQVQSALFAEHFVSNKCIRSKVEVTPTHPIKQHSNDHLL